MAITWATKEDAKAADLDGTLTGFDDAKIDYWLGRAKRAILNAVPDIEARVAAKRVDSDTPGDVQIDLVLGKFSNPGGIRTVQESNGPTSGSVTYGGENPGTLELSKQQLRDLLGAGRPKGRAGGISMIPSRAGWDS